MIKITTIDYRDTDQFIELLRFRYKIYIEELSYIKQKYEFKLLKMEFDEFDMFSTFIVLKNDNNIVGCVRIIKDKPIGLPVYKKTNILKNTNISNKKNVEIGRLMVLNTKRNSMFCIMLMKQVFKLLLCMECDNILADTFKNSTSYKVLKKLGFSEDENVYRDDYFNLATDSTILFFNMNKMKEELKTNPNKSQKAFLRYLEKR